MKALPLLFLHVEQWQRYRGPGAELMANTTALHRQEAVVEKPELEDAIGVYDELAIEPLGMKRPCANIYAYDGKVEGLGTWLQRLLLA